MLVVRSRDGFWFVELLFIIFIGVLLIVYVLGEHAGREGPTRNKQLQEIVKQEAELKNLKSNLHATTTSPWMHLVVVLILVFVLLSLIGRRDDDHWDRRRYR